MKTIAVNVSALAPPEPMQVILSSLAELPNGAVLRVNHRREPFPLYERLLANGWLYYCEHVSYESFVIYIAHEQYKAQFGAYIDSSVQR